MTPLGLDMGTIDGIDRQILGALQRNARLSRAELARLVGLSPSAVADRIRRLEDSRVILGYSAVVDPKKLGYGIDVIMRLSPETGQLRNIAKVAAATPEVVECHRVTGEDCYVMHIVLASIDELEELIDRFTPLGRTTTSIVNGTPVPRRAIPLDRSR
ncbi:MAG TPA: Lrp/AsnC family transcriptional regulator [Actinomycetota bacterium]|nr:Lrp/AsnC family transcriptional regulator [Actinomycetota bacterium]